MERKNYYDIAKFIAILSVIIYHVENYLIDNQIIYSFINTYFLSLFFIISGLLLKSEKVFKRLVKEAGSQVDVTFLHLLYRI